ncbi:hypothetical protein INT45_012364 [Circinella minor]|uniref:Uncharacterized protein n=1 Tax=Circinella minor TaxID=1195481 RepID=A0A8H7VLV3_9FUNG|nr:hypothetical protein INT45_012364 [Circinella minor]
MSGQTSAIGVDNAITIQFPKEKEVKLDLLVFNKHYGDIFACEDKPVDTPGKDLLDDKHKGQKLAEKRLLHIQALLPYPCMIESIEVLSAQFHGLKLIVYGSKMTKNGDFVHYQKCETAVPTIGIGEFSQAASFLSTVISFQRNVMMCLKKIQVMCQEAYQYPVEYLELPSNNQETFCRDDTPESDNGCVKSSVSVESQRSDGDWRSEVRKQSIMNSVHDKLEKMCYG